MAKNNDILVVEDDKDLRESIKDILELEGYNIFEAENVKNAFSLVKQKKLDLIISDILMPGDSGHELLIKIRSIPELKNLPFIFLTAQSDLRQVRSGMNLGADDYLTKPFRREDLVSSVKHRLEKKLLVDSKLELFSKGISKYVPHELRTPLVAILGYPEFVKENIGILNQNEIVEIMNSITFAGNRMQDTLEKFIIYSDICSTNLVGDLIPNAEFSNIESAFKVIINELKPKNYGERSWKLDIEESTLRISSRHFTIIIMQLLENSLKFSDEGSLINISGKNVEDQYKIEILDNGIGMTQEALSKLGAFVQINRDEKQQSGNGLGLAIVTKLLELYNSNLKIKSDYGKGTKVSFSLDLNEQSK